MSESVYIACDLSGIQRYVLGIKAGGKAQAKRLRARSFLLELFERAALAVFQERLGIVGDDVLVSGGGGFLVRASSETDLQEAEKISMELERKVWNETGGEIQFSVGSGDAPTSARESLEYRKRRPGASILQNGDGWRTDGADALSQSSLNTPCKVCGRAPGKEEIEEDGENVLYCDRCANARKLGEKMVDWDWMHPAAGGDGVIPLVLGIGFTRVQSGGGDAFRVSRWVPRDGKALLTFEEIAGRSRGDKKLAVLKADVDDMGKRIGEIARADHDSYKNLKEFSGRLHSFFVDDVQEMLSKRWRSIYTIYAGGDDLLLVGPWDVIVGFAGELHEQFNAGPGGEYDLTLSAGIAVSPYRTPIRHAVERAETLLEAAKKRDGKSSCAALDSIWKWERHGRIIGDGDRLAGWINGDRASRALLQRLLKLAESEEPVRTARWAYQVQRNIRDPEVRCWATGEEQYLQDSQRVSEVVAILKYALLATRKQKDEQHGG